MNSRYSSWRLTYHDPQTLAEINPDPANRDPLEILIELEDQQTNQYSTEGDNDEYPTPRTASR